MLLSENEKLRNINESKMHSKAQLMFMMIYLHEVNGGVNSISIFSGND
jgi:hypothetical protein